MHSAQWDPSYDVTGKRVAVIGTGASAVQIVPRVHETARRNCTSSSARRRGSCRTARGRSATGSARSTAASPIAQRAVRNAVYYRSEFLFLPALLKSQRLELIRKMALEHLESQVPRPRAAQEADADVRARLQAADADERIPAGDRITAHHARDRRHRRGHTRGHPHQGRRAARARRHHPRDRLPRDRQHLPGYITGRDGRTLREVWDSGSMGGYNGTTFSGFPNLFMLAGPTPASVTRRSST